jgi:hypothetical protein
MRADAAEVIGVLALAGVLVLLLMSNPSKRFMPKAAHRHPRSGGNFRHDTPPNIFHFLGWVWFVFRGGGGSIDIDSSGQAAELSALLREVAPGAIRSRRHSVKASTPELFKCPVWGPIRLAAWPTDPDTPASTEKGHSEGLSIPAQEDHHSRPRRLCPEPSLRARETPSAYFSDRGRPFQADRGRQISAVGDAPGRRASSVLNVSQSSTISLKRSGVAWLSALF